MVLSFHLSYFGKLIFTLDAAWYITAALQALNHKGRQPLHLACRNGHREVSIELLEHGADPSARDVDGMQVLVDFVL